MRLLADEDVDLHIVERLRGDGQDVTYVAEMAPGLADDAVLELANREGRLLLTADRDFGELVFRQRRFTSGIVLIRLAGLSSRSKADTVAAAIAGHGAQLPGAFSVVTPGAVRVRQAGG